MVTSLEDVTADMVIAALNRRGVPLVRVDPADIDPVASFDGAVTSSTEAAVAPHPRRCPVARPGLPGASTNTFQFARPWMESRVRAKVSSAMVNSAVLWWSIAAVTWAGSMERGSLKLTTRPVPS